MSFIKARGYLEGLANECNLLKQRILQLEAELLIKSENLARLERKKPGKSRLLPFPIGEVKLKKTETKISNDHAFPEIETDSLIATLIEDWGLFLGGNIVARSRETLLSLGITRVLNAAHGVCPNYFEHEFNMKYTSFELIDHPSENIDHFLLQAIAEIESARENNEKILVHCHQGVSRSATLVIAYIAWRKKISVMDALMYTKSRRKIVQPNSGFILQLKEFQKRISLEENMIINPTLHYVVPHSDDVTVLVVKQVFDPDLPKTDPSHVFLLHEGLGGNLYIRIPKEIKEKRFLDTAIRFADWMCKYQVAYRNSKVVLLEYQDDRFYNLLNRIPALVKDPILEHIDASKV